MQKTNSGKNVLGLTGILLIILADRITAIINFLNNTEVDSAFLALFSLLMSLATLWYLTSGYLKAHGNTLRIIYFLFSLYLAFHASVDLAFKNYLLSGYTMLLSALIVAYIAGRLDKLKKNKTLLAISGMLMLADVIVHTFISNSFSIYRLFSLSIPFMLFTAINLSYILRYKAHKEAK